MPPDRIIKALHEVKHVRARRVSRRTRLARGPLRLERREETLHDGVLPHVTGPTHAAGNAQRVQRPLQLRARILGGFNRSSQHRVVRQIVDGRSAPLPLT